MSTIIDNIESEESLNLTIPSNWRKATISLPLKNRTVLAGKALSKLNYLMFSENAFNQPGLPVESLNISSMHFSASTPTITATVYVPPNSSYFSNPSNPDSGSVTPGPANILRTLASTFGDPAILCNLMMHFDRLIGHTFFNDTITQWLRAVNHQVPAFRNVNLNATLNFGQTAIEAYLYYGGQAYLTMAQSAWEVGQEYTITPSQAKSMSSPVKDFKFATCGGPLNWTGATFSQIDRNGSFISLANTGEFFLLSSLLANATLNSTYIQAASLSYDIMSGWYGGGNPFLPDELDVGACPEIIPEGQRSVLNTALFLEGTVQLGFATGNVTQRNLSLGIGVSNAFQYHTFVDNQGILLSETQGSSLGSGRLIRALSTAYQLNLGNSQQLRDYVKSFISVQYNAVVDLASDQNFYGESWNSPLPQDENPKFSAQASALEVLLAGVAVEDLASSPLTPSTTTRPSVSPLTITPPITNHAAPLNIRAVVGGAIAGMLCVFCVMLFMTCRRRRKRKDSALAPDPLTIPASDTPRNPLGPPMISRTFRWSDKKETLPVGVPEPDSEESNGESARLIDSGTTIEPAGGIARGPAEDVVVAENNARSRDGRRGYANLSISELVRVLNDRLLERNFTWDEEEVPPVYGQGRSADAQSENGP